MAELLPCPFCGGRATLSDGDCGRWGINCGSCEADPFVIDFDTPEAAAAVWNRRPPTARSLEDAVWIVEGSVGRYSDARQWVVGVWSTEDEAQKFITEITARGQVFQDATRAWFDKEPADDALEEAMRVAANACRELDPAWSEYSGEAPEYICWYEHIRALPAADELARLRTALATAENATLERAARPAHGASFCIEHDGFAGTVQGRYVTREGKPGVVLQQHGTRVVHVYGEKWLKTEPKEKTSGAEVSN